MVGSSLNETVFGIGFHMNKATRAVIFAVGMLFVGEVALQVRAHMKFGTSVLNAVSGETTYQLNDTFGLKLLRPSATIVGSDVRIVTNSYGLRSPEIEQDRPPNAVRIAVVGASSVMGAYSRTNEDTFSYGLERILSARYHGAKVDVINAGIAGYSLTQQQRIIENLLTTFNLDVIILYTGFNDISGYCRAGDGTKSNAPKNHALHKVNLPSWVLSYELLLKNTMQAREAEAKQAGLKSNAVIDTTRYEANLLSLVATAKRHARHVLLATNARSYRRDMPREEQMALSVTARYYNDCFDLDGLHDVYDAHNAIILKVAAAQQVPTVPMHEIMPPGRAYFGDSVHFTPKGENKAAQIFARYLKQNGMID